MNELNLATRIRQLRKKKGITQETMAAALLVSPQAVSKWESGVSYPELTLIPALARYLGVSLDYLFDYDPAAVEQEVMKLVQDNWALFFDNPGKYQSMIRSALMKYPEHEGLLSALLDSYEYELRNFDRTDHLEEIIELSARLMDESRNVERICSAMDVQAAAWLKLGREDKAITILEAMPREVDLRYDSMAFRLTGEKKLEAAVKAQRVHLQNLYMGCFEEGNALFFLGRYREAVTAYERGRMILTMYLNNDRQGQKAYLWDGMQTFHWGFHLLAAACRNKLGEKDACEAELETVWRIISTAWEDFREKKDEYMQAVYAYMEEYGLVEYLPMMRKKAD